MKDMEKLPPLAIAMLITLVAPQLGGGSDEAESTGPWLLAPQGSSLVLDVNPTSNAPVMTASRNRPSTQHWTLRDAPDDTVALVNENGTCLTSNASTVSVSTCNTEHNRAQHWHHNNGMLRNELSGQCLTAADPTPGAEVTSIDCATQRWTLIPITTPSNPSTT